MIAGSIATPFEAPSERYNTFVILIIHEETLSINHRMLLPGLAID
jgi:hypothetical protein